MKTFKTTREIVSELKLSNVKRVFDSVDCFNNGANFEYGEIAETILDIVRKYGQGFVLNICEKALVKGIVLSDKQRWCVAYAFQKITEGQIAEYFDSIAAEIDEEEKEEETAEESEEETATATEEQSASKSADDVHRNTIYLIAGRRVSRIDYYSSSRRERPHRFEGGILIFEKC